MPEGYLLSADHLKQLRAVVRDHHSQPNTRPRYRRRQPVFQPSTAGTVYQCVYGTRLRAGTAADDEDTSKREPVCLAIPLGDVSAGDLRNLTHNQVRRLRDILTSAGAIDKKGMISQKTIDDLVGNRRIGDIVGEQLGEAQSVRCLRTRFVPGYVGTGSVVIGNDDEAWHGIGGQVRTATIDSSIDDDSTDGLYLATLTINQAAIDDEVASLLIDDYVVLRDEIAPGATMLEDWEVGVDFEQQIWFDDDTGYEPDYWYQHEERGWLPVFSVAHRPMELIGKTDASHAKNASGTISIWTGETAATLADSTDNATAYNRYADIDSGKWVTVRAFDHGYEVQMAEC